MVESNENIVENKEEVKSGAIDVTREQIEQLLEGKSLTD